MKGFEKLAILVYTLIDTAFTGSYDAAQPVGSFVTDRLQQPPHGPSRRDRDVGIPADLISYNQPKVKLLQGGLSTSLVNISQRATLNALTAGYFFENQKANRAASRLHAYDELPCRSVDKY